MRWQLFFVFIFLSCVFPCLAEAGKNFKTTLAGTWYPSDKAELTKQLGALYKAANAEEKADVIALIQPHAGYQYSGKTAFSGIKSLGRSYKRIIVFGPSHSVRMPEIFSVPKYDSFETPLGKAAMDTDFIDRLLKCPVFLNVPEALTREHSVQIQIPLLQYAYEIRKTEDRGQRTDDRGQKTDDRGQTTDDRGQTCDFPKIVFIIAGQCSMDTVRKAGKALKDLLDDDTLLLISSDFTHYGDNFGYFPFRDNVAEKLKELDFGAFELIRKKDAEGFGKYIEKTGDTICGYIPIETLLTMLPEDASAVKIAYTTSGESTRDYSSSVSYFSIAFTGKWGGGAKPEQDSKAGMLTEKDREVLLALARKTIAYYLDKRKTPEPADLGIELTEGVKAQRSCFVTLKKNGELRGCIGEIFPSQPLYKSVITHAIASAFRDPRFEPVTKGEAGKLSIEISALTPPKEVPTYKDIRIGTDGMVLKKGMRSAVFLPQVATEQGWNLEQTLSYLSRKAGLPENAWKDGASYLTFQAEVFGEHDR